MGINLDEIINNLENNLYKKENETKIYHIMKINNFFELMRTKSLIFKRPKLWGDPYEDFISKEKFVSKNGQEIQYDLDMVYAQCWTFNQECDGMWKSFASIDCGIKIETSISKFYKIMLNRNNVEENNFIGKVLYVTRSETDEFLYDENMHQWLISGKYNPLAQIFLIKREEFSYEKEVRAIILDSDYKEDTIKLKINPVDFITKIIFAPKMSEEDFISYKCKLAICYGFDEKIITRSDLYDEY